MTDVNTSRRAGAGQLLARTASAALAFSALAASSQPVLAQDTGASGTGASNSASEAVNCDEGRKLFLFAYWKFMHTNPECARDLDDDAFFLKSMASEPGGPVEQCRSTRGRSGRCGGNDYDNG